MKILHNSTHISMRGFTLIEIILVIGILMGLATMVLLAINPARQFSIANNTKRKSDVVAILNAVQQHLVDNKGRLPVGISTTTQSIRKTNGADICSALVTRYLSALPVDPQTNNGTPVTDCSSEYDTNYLIIQNSQDNHVTVSAPAAELGEVIGVTQ
jgi:type II secretory pathway pseudopilin PulG